MVFTYNYLQNDSVDCICISTWSILNELLLLLSFIPNRISLCALKCKLNCRNASVQDQFKKCTPALHNVLTYLHLWFLQKEENPGTRMRAPWYFHRTVSFQFFQSQFYPPFGFGKKIGHSTPFTFRQ